MGDSYFELIFDDCDEAAGTGLRRVRPGPATVGPWSPQLQHGGPPNALAVASAEDLVRRTTGHTDLAARRLAADFIGAVPVAELEIHTSLLRVARSAALAEVRIASGDRECLTARVWFVRERDTAAFAPAPAPPAGVPEAEPQDGLGIAFGYGESIEWRFLHGAMTTPGPAAAWTRPRTDLGLDATMSALARTVLVADSASGISAELDWSTWSFVNVDLDVHLARAVEGEWLLMDAHTTIGPQGTAVARSTLSDLHGELGGGLQTLVLTPIPTR